MTDENLQEFKTRLTAERKAIMDKIRNQEEEENSLFRESDDDLFEQVSDPTLEVLDKLTDKRYFINGVVIGVSSFGLIFIWLFSKICG